MSESSQKPEPRRFTVGVKVTRRQRKLLDDAARQIGGTRSDVILGSGLGEKLKELEANPPTVCPTCGRPHC